MLLYFAFDFFCWHGLELAAGFDAEGLRKFCFNTHLPSCWVICTASRLLCVSFISGGLLLRGGEWMERRGRFMHVLLEGDCDGAGI